ncbi:hypothetical protein Ddc_16543 [Ditylenchus destructor]|nr:hypothetical protein Ddc_16543 [Ditylenchus destructor]
MRRLTEKQVKFENEARAQEPSAQKNRSGNRITNIATLDNGTMVQVFKYLKYSGLAKTSLVSKRFCNLIRTHRHTLALLDVKSINMREHTDFRSPTLIKIFDKVLSAEAYNEWVIHNGYSKLIPFKVRVVGEQVFQLSAHADYKDSKPLEREAAFLCLKELQLFFANIELIDHKDWPVFQHFFRLLTDPFVYIRHIGLPTQNNSLNLLASAIKPDYGRLRCHLLTVSLEDNMQNFMSWIKGHVQCFKIDIINSSGLNHDDEFVDFFMTGGNCTSEVEVNFYDPCKAIGDFVQKFMVLKSSDEDKVVGFIECHPNRKANMDAFNRNYADFVVEGNINETRGSSNLVFEFVNNDIGKKLRLEISFGYRTTEFTLKVANL